MCVLYMRMCILCSWHLIGELGWRRLEEYHGKSVRNYAPSNKLIRKNTYLSSHQKLSLQKCNAYRLRNNFLACVRAVTVSVFLSRDRKVYLQNYIYKKDVTSSRCDESVAKPNVIRETNLPQDTRRVCLTCLTLCCPEVMLPKYLCMTRRSTRYVGTVSETRRHFCLRYLNGWVISDMVL